MRTCAVALLVVLATAPAARAVECAPMAGGGDALARVDGARRLGFLRERLALDARRVRVWAWSWTAAYSIGAVGNFAWAAASDRAGRIDHVATAGSTLVGLVTLVVTPRKILRDQRWLESRIERGGDVCALVAEGERLLARDAADEERGRSTRLQAASYAFNIGVGLLL